MKSVSFRLSVLLSILFLVAPLRAVAGIRETINFNRDWTFKLGDLPGAETTAFADKSWERANLPHSFSLPYFLSDRFYVGFGWYRKRFVAPPVWKNRRVNLEFDGVFQVAEVFVNGRRMGEHRGGYTGFSIDVTEAVKPGENVVAVRVNNQWDARLAPRAGEHVFSGGIYRNVRLVVTAPTHVAWYGTFVTTPRVSKESGTVNVKTEVVNDSATSKRTTVRSRILDPSGRRVAQVESTLNLPPNSTHTLNQTSAPILRPKLWSPESPTLYRVETTLLEGGKAVDEYGSTMGFRWFEFTADRGFFLNGDHRYLRGANVHQDHAGWGDAVADSGFSRDVRLIKEAGFDFIRGSHYPHAPAFSKACDELGMLFWSENCFWGTTGFRSLWSSSAFPTDTADEAEFEESVRSSLREMIRIHRNHPSIVVWSMDNEVFFSASSVMPKVRKFLKELVAYSHSLDPSRPSAVGGAQRGEIDRLGDVAGYNGDGARLFPNPGIPNVVSEYGSTITDRPGKYEPGWGDLPATPGANANDPQSWRFPWRSGEVIWCGFDHGSLGGKFGAMGILDHFRLPKRQWYWYRNEYRHIPPPEWPTKGVPAALRLSTDRATLQSADGTEDAQLIATVVDAQGRPLSDSPPVTFEIESGPGEFPTGRRIEFRPDSDIAIRDGQAAIEFRAYQAGATTIRATSPGLKDATIRIVSRGGPKFIAGRTPLANLRPYVRFVESARGAAPLALGRQTPTRASSEANGHAGRLANDGDPATSWQSVVADENPWVLIDLERLAALSSVRLTFPDEADRRLRIEISEDGESWKVLSGGDWRRTKERHLTIQGEGRGRFLRIAFGKAAGGSASLSEFEAQGIVSP
jgi:beta-galactosidase